MKPILILTNANFLGHMVRCIEIASALRTLGAPVIFAASGRYVDLLHRWQFSVLPLFTPDRDRTLAAITANNFDFYDLPLARQCVEAETACIRQVDPSVVVGDFRWTAKMSAEQCTVPYASVINVLWTPYGQRTSAGPGNASPKAGLVRRLRRRLARTLHRQSRQRLQSPFALLRAELGLLPFRGFAAEICGDLNLMPDLPQLYPPAAELPENFHFVGPLFGADGILPAPAAVRLPDEPYLYCSLSSAATPGLIELVIAAFGNSTQPVVMSTGRQALPASLPANIHCYDFLSDDVFTRAHAIVCYGGNGTIYRALAHGTPIIGIATHREQIWQLAGVAARKVGLAFAERDVTVAELRGAVDAILRDPEYRQNCARFQALIAASQAAESAARLIVEFAQEDEQKPDARTP